MTAAERKTLLNMKTLQLSVLRIRMNQMVEQLDNVVKNFKSDDVREKEIRQQG